MIIGVCWTFTGLALLFVAARLYSCAVLSNILVTISVYWGNGQHFDALDLQQKQNTVKWMIAAYVPGIETLGFPKLAVIALLTRLLAPSRLHIYVLWTMGIVCCMSLTAMVMTLILQCTPPQALWNFSLPHNCLKPSILEGLAFWASTCSAFLDFYLAIYPAVVLFKLQMPMQKKLALCCALGMGVVSGCVGIVKATGVPTLASPDASSCIPLLQPLIERIKGRSIWPSKKTSSNNRQYENFSKQSAGQPDALELRSKPKKKVDTYGFTIHAKEDSEENIVNPDKHSTTTSSGRQSPGTYHPTDREGIIKTNSVTVAYDQGEEGGPTSAATRWAAV
ncbi:hypothetical protein CONLIGDRAFT_703922 [Coniochaeta ligniaria NRRL 30616]|uniref:Rhodopsin domain-containing protein n=1 Tax=Coniochaeta ligniaria NRRL 30616 TaxID=1408157 RepID=A0A1J7JM30_9PEZI|nr:hypothetical protein CONLIGDRAFT_703922 [Coniochaeta ligniaria NRRL 30616]